MPLRYLQWTFTTPTMLYLYRYEGEKRHVFCAISVTQDPAMFFSPRMWCFAGTVMKGILRVCRKANPEILGRAMDSHQLSPFYMY